MDDTSLHGKELNNRLYLRDCSTEDEMLENVIRDIIQLLVKEPLARAILAEELNVSLENTLSRIRIDQECNIFFTDYGNVMLDIDGYQAKTLYMFYLISKKSVSNMDLPAHKDTLIKIYQIISRKDNCRSADSVGGLLRKERIPDVNHKINAALDKIVPQENRRYYTIRGGRNCSRQILLPKHMIEIENEGLQRISRGKNARNGIK